MIIHQELVGLPLIRYGFVHVTGLIVSLNSQDQKRIMAFSDEYGKWDRKDGMTTIVVNGEVWLRREAGIDIDHDPEFISLLGKLCPNGKGVFVHCSGGESISPYALLSRVSNPYWTGPKGEFSYG